MQHRAPAAFTPCSNAQTSYRVRLEDSRWLPSSGELPRAVRALVDRGERRIVLDLAGVVRIDAAGIGELVRGYNIALARRGAVRIVNVNHWVRVMLERVGLFDHLNAGQLDER